METLIKMKRAISSIHKKNFWFHFLLLAVLLLFFVLMFVGYGPGVYNDSDQYIKMHIHREPGYPLFLKALRDIFGEQYLVAMGYIQNVFMAVAIYFFTRTISRRFELPFLGECVVAGIQVFPHLMTKYFSAMSIFVTNSVMSEALCLPLFTIWSMNCLQMLWEGKRKNILAAGGLSLLLSLVRSQFMITILIWMLCMLWIKLFQGKTHRICWTMFILVLTGLLFSARTLAVKSYNLHYNGHFINNTYGNVNLFTNMLYASDRSYGEDIEDEQARTFFYQMYDLAEAAGANYKYAGHSMAERAQHIEKYHDDIKFLYIEDVFYQYYDHHVTTDYITQNLLADEVAMKMMKGIFPKCFGTWLKTYFCIAYFGLIRSVAVVHPLLNVAAMGIYVLALFSGVFLWKQKKDSPAIPMMLFAFLFIGANVYAVSITIMCLSRYMIYGFSLFYTSWFLVLYELIKPRLCAKLFQE